MAYVSLPPVVGGEPILSSWGNLVDSNLDDLDARIVRLMSDTGWMTFTPFSGFGGQVLARRIGAFVTVNIVANKTGSNIAAQDVSLANVGAALGPTVTAPRGVCFVGAPVGGATPFQIESNGAVRFTLLTVNAGSGITGSITYPINLP